MLPVFRPPGAGIFRGYEPPPHSGLNRPHTLDQRKLEFSGFIQGGGLVALPEFISEIGTLLPIAP
ncbi:hypothetical protein B5P45_19235 [Phyllobacterium zundukense]|uniref:Uncharacterized protein n=1 Tax=Phyllobacterium zundukense TaxID=1867719 RepID=A0A2N9VUQ0_9HYPH|nr:hypothetical protein B5P45_19235 [Phyllobacterium zundukense]